MRNYRVFLRPFSFLMIKHPSRIFLNVIWIAPILISSAIIAIIYYIANNINIFGESGLILRITGFVQNLPGFYIAALAAIATFGSRSLNKVMPGKAPTLNIYFNSRVLINEPLTRRLFLCSMFAYLTTLSFILTFAGIFLQNIAAEFNFSFYSEIKFFVFWIYAIFVLQLLLITLWGIAYLGERMHISDQ